ncbi:unnamed protein product [Phaedon cochleariae]|uniref:Uncharacterized protein n=1 Tax=Phaedon cochleariae TaxID=80249 RepID=A0A9P0GVC2_PHACE|nr:unnamed protein product [Phaedon cochleariae]
MLYAPETNHDIDAYFIGNTALADCSLQPTSAILIINELTKSSTLRHADNPINALTHAFHPVGVFGPEYIHETTEIKIAPASMMIVKSTKTNVTVTPTDLGPHSHLGDVHPARTGPYWKHFPYHRYSS